MMTYTNAGFYAWSNRLLRNLKRAKTNKYEIWISKTKGNFYMCAYTVSININCAITININYNMTVMKRQWR